MYHMHSKNKSVKTLKSKFYKKMRANDYKFIFLSKSIK